MTNKIVIKKKIKPFNKIIKVDGDKSISIRWLLLASQTTGISKAYGILQSEDIFNTIKCLKRLGVKIKIKKSYCELHGVGINGFKIKKNIKKKASPYQLLELINLNQLNILKIEALLNVKVV